MSGIDRSVNRLIFEGKLDEADRLVDQALVASPGELGLHRLKVRLLLARNRPEEAVRYLEALQGMDPVVLAAERASLLVTLGRAAEALALLTTVSGKGPDQSTPPCLLAPWVDVLEATGDAQSALQAARLAETAMPGSIPLATMQRLQQKAVEATRRRVSLRSLLDEYVLAGEGRPTPELAARVFGLFRGKEDAYARQIRFKAGNFGYVPVYESLRPETVLGHLEGRETLGIYLLDHDSRTRVLCLDIDVDKGLVPSFLDGSRTAELEESLRSVVHGLRERFAAAGWPLYPEKSGQKGYHLWGFLADPVPARHVRSVAQAVLPNVVVPAGVHVDVFPAQDRVQGKGFGNLVKLPLGIHQATGGRSLFLIPETLDPHPEPGIYLQQVAVLTSEEFRQVISRLALDRCPTGGAGEMAKGRIIPFPRTPRVLPPAAARLPETLPEAVEQVVRGCALVFHLVAKAREGQPLAEVEAHVLAYVLKPLGEPGEIFFHQVMGLAGAYDADWGLAKLNAVGPTIISCQKVRQRLCHLGGSVGCRCEFALGPKQYASPLIHAGIVPECAGKLPFGVRSEPPLPVPTPLAGVGPMPGLGPSGPDPVSLLAAQEGRVERERKRLEGLKRWLEAMRRPVTEEPTGEVPKEVPSDGRRCAER